MDNKKLNWGIIGTGWIVHEMGEALNKVNGEIYAVCSTSLEKAQKYAKEFDVINAYRDVDELLADEKVDIVYIATPHNSHYELILQALKVGKHVFCEKSITVNSRQLEECVAIAEEKNLDEASFVEEAIEICELCHRYNVPLIINDNVEVALKSGADNEFTLEI